MLWSPFRRRTDDPITRQLKAAEDRNRQQAQISQEARAHLTAATEAEQEQIRHNHLGWLVKDSLISRRHRPT